MSTDYLLLYSIITGLFLCLSLACIGSVALWKNAAFLGEAISHASLMGVILSIVLVIDVTIGLIIYSVGFSILIYFLRNIKFSNVSSLIVSYILLSLGIVFLGMYKRINFDLMSLLFGDILLVNHVDLIISVIIFVIVIFWLLIRWKKIISCVLNEEMAFVDGYNPDRINLEFFLLISLVVAMSIKIIGILMVTAMLIIPSAAASSISRSPHSMILKSGIISSVSLMSGLFLSYFFDIATGPTIVLSSSVLFVCLLLYNRYSYGT